MVTLTALTHSSDGSLSWKTSREAIWDGGMVCIVLISLARLGLSLTPETAGKFWNRANFHSYHCYAQVNVGNSNENPYPVCEMNWDC